MRLAGFVHRDISPGNCMLYRNNGTIQIKISDLEYSRLYEDRSHQPSPITVCLSL